MSDQVSADAGSTGRPHVVLCSPPDGLTDATNTGLPLLALAGAVEQAGYPVRLIQGTAGTTRHEDLVREALPGAACVGISSAIGPQVTGALRLSRMVKRHFPQTPVVWGGWFPSVRPDAVLSDPSIDLVVRGQGEVTFVEMLERLVEGRPMEGLAGVSFREDGVVRHNADRAPLPAGELPPVAYHLMDTRRHLEGPGRQILHGRPVLEVSASRGCPLDCHFCCSAAVYHRMWSGLPPEQVVADIEHVVSLGPPVFVRINDANFFSGGRRWVMRICELLEQEEWAQDLRWGAAASVNALLVFSDEDMRRLAASGLRRVMLGVESGCAETLKLFNKPVNLDRLPELLNRLAANRIEFLLELITSLPGEPQGALGKTLDLAARSYQRHPDQALVDLFFFQRLPGTGLADTPAVMAHYREPQTLEAWGQVVLYADPPFRAAFSRRYFSEIYRFRIYDKLARLLHRRAKAGGWLRPLYRAAWRLAVLRMHHRWLIISPEYWLYLVLRVGRRLARRAGR